MLNRIKNAIKRLFVKSISLNELESGRPFTSQNTWERMEHFYMNLPHTPIILEYGSGYSTYFHLKNLENKGGHLVTIEHDPIWYKMLKLTLKKRFKKEKFTYLLRRSNSKRTGCGTLEEFRDYVTEPKDKFDLIVIDGRARKACVNWVLDKDLLKSGGMLVLFEAGRGNSVWPKKNQMVGTYDYKPEVEKLIKRGGFLVDGTGYENWTNWSPNRPSHENFSGFVPMEALFWIRSAN